MRAFMRKTRWGSGCVILCAVLSGCNGGGAVDAGAGSATARDSDADGVRNESDLCPGTSGGAVVDVNGCSAAQLDSDQDGVNNASDQCPNTPVNEEVDANGCTRVFAWRTQADPFISPLISLVPASYEMSSRGSFQQARYETAGLVALLNLANGLGDFGGGDDDGGGGGGSDFQIQAESVSSTARIGEQVTLVRATFQGGPSGLSGTLGILLTINAFEVEFADGVATWTFDVTAEMSISGLLVLSNGRYTGTASGTVSADGSSILWTSVAGTLTTSGGFQGSEASVPLEELFIPDESNPEGGVLPEWTLQR